MKFLNFVSAILITLLFSGASEAFGADKPQSFVAAVQLTGGTSENDSRFGTIQSYEQKGQANAAIPLAAIEHPAVDQPRYAVTGYIRYSAVPAAGYLETWNHFPGGASYFSRTLAPSGEMGQIIGDSEWRRFILPFYTDGSPQKIFPERIDFNLFLAQGGKVSLAQVELHQFNSAQDPLLAFSGGWWGVEAANRFSALFTPIVVVWWLAASFLAWRGMARSGVIGSIKLAAVLGVVSLAAFVAALIIKQPLHVILPLGISGAILAGPALVQMRKISSHYDQIDQRRMLARDAKL